MTHQLAKSVKWLLPKALDTKQDLDIKFSEPLIAVLIRRGFTTLREINEFIYPQELPDPLTHFPDLDKAINRLHQACINREKIAICGDYDADGITSTTLLSEVFSKLQAETTFLIPSRIEEGYGLNKKMISELHKKNVKVIVTVDNGVSATDALSLANNLGIDVIISDHHKIPAKLDNIYALIHPDTTPIDSPYKFLAGVGLAYIIALKISEKFQNKQIISNSLDFFSIGTIADMTLLQGANRFWLRKALPNLSKTKCKGLKKIQITSGINNNYISSTDIAFKIAPRINSIGRISNPSIIIKLLLEDNNKKIEKLSDYCENINIKRRYMCQETEKEALSLIGNDILNNRNFILLYKQNWHSGVIGIIAARIVERYNKPTAVLTEDQKGNLRASARSPYGFNLIEALDQCKEILDSYGGHSAAAGFTIQKCNLAKLQEKLNQITSKYPEGSFDQKISPEAHLNFSQIDDNLISDLSILEPFGVGNPKPIFWTRGCIVKEVRILKNKYISIYFEHKGIKIQAMDWTGDFKYEIGSKVDIAYNLEKNIWKNKARVQINLISSRNFNEVCFIYQSNNRYCCFLTPDKKIRLINSKGDELSNDNDIDKLFSGKSRDISYIKSLFALASVALGKSV